MHRGARSLLAAAAVFALGACAREDPGPDAPATANPAAARPQTAGESAADGLGAGPSAASPQAKWDLVRRLRREDRAERHPGDGGGRAWLEGGDGGTAPVVESGAHHRFVVFYEAGPHGIAPGGSLYFQVSPFAGSWSAPQLDHPGQAGYTTVASEAPGVGLETAVQDANVVAIRISGRALGPGERVRITYGDGPRRARADRYAERGSRFWIAVDSDGDGVHAYLADSPAVDIEPGPAAAVRVAVPATARAGAAIEVSVALIDRWRNAGLPWAGELALQSLPPGLELPRRVTLAANDGGRARIPARAPAEGVYRVRVRAGRLRATSNPVVVGDGPRVLWGDLHGHSNLSDGTGTPEDYFRYARDTAGLDVGALTDHDHWGILHLDDHPASWSQIRDAVRRFHAPGRFVALLGYEWTSWIYGHRHVLYFDGDDSGEVLSSIDRATDSPAKLWRALRGRPAVTIPHHPAGGVMPLDWEVEPDPDLEPVVEIASIHGSSESPDSPSPIRRALPGHFVRDALDRGRRYGFVASGDRHDGHPGLEQPRPVSGGLAGILSEELTRAGVLEALRARRVYATNGSRILLQVTLGGRPMGAQLPAPPGGRALLSLRVVSPGELAHIDLVRNGVVSELVAGEGRRDVALERPLENLRRGDYLYVRAVQLDGGAAWASPFYVD